MAQTREHGFLDALLQQPPAYPAESAWLARLRSAALERANALSVPSTRDEEWRFTDLAPLTRLSFQPVAGPGSVDAAAVRARFLPEALIRLVFIDGVYAPELSSPHEGEGVHACELRSASTKLAAIQARFGTAASFEANLFAALNTAFLRDGAAVVLEPDAAAPSAIQILHVSTRRERAHAIYPRLLVVAGAGSRATLIEEYVEAANGAAYFSAPVSEVLLGANAAIDHVRIQCEGEAAYQLAGCAVSQQSGSRYRGANMVFGARLSRLDWTVLHEASGCESALDGLTLIGGRQLADTHSAVDHAHPQGRLRQLHKCVVSGGAHAVFNGKVLVRPGAQQTDAAQSCRGLLLSRRAQMDAKPQLEIFADDVKCAHGAAIGQLDPEELFYLRARGLSEARAKSLLTYAFAAEVIERIPVPTLVERLERMLVERTPEAT